MSEDFARSSKRSRRARTFAIVALVAILVGVFVPVISAIFGS